MAYFSGPFRPDPTVGTTAYARKAQSSADGFPYDRDDDGGYDTAPRFPGAGKDRISGNREPLRGYLVPDDEERTQFSAFEEALGTPINFTIGTRPGMTSQTGIPGASGMKGWAGSPTKPWDHDEDEPMLSDMFPDVSKGPESAIMNVVGSGFGSGLGRSNPSGRGYMLGWTEDKEPRSSWDDAMDIIKDLISSKQKEIICLPNGEGQ